MQSIRVRLRLVLITLNDMMSVNAEVDLLIQSVKDLAVSRVRLLVLCDSLSFYLTNSSPSIYPVCSSPYM